MPPRKEPKETVVYPASKQKAPPFKPLRPNMATAEARGNKRPQPRTDSKQARPSSENPITVSDSEDDSSLVNSGTPGTNTRRSTPSGHSEEELDDDPLASKVYAKVHMPPPQTTSRQHSFRAPGSTRLVEDLNPAMNLDRPPEIDMAGISMLSQPLLLRLLHEAFRDKATKIDKHAIQLVQEYINVFLREAMARSVDEKKVTTQNGAASDVDDRWLELDDLEKIAPGLLLDF